MSELYTKEFLKEMTGMRWFDREVEWLNQMLKAYREGKKLYIMPARATTKTKLANTYHALCAAEDSKKPFIYFDEFISEGMDEVYFDDEDNKIVQEQLKAESIKRKDNIYDYYEWRLDEDESN